MEAWKDIIGFEGLYQISSLGRIKSCERLARARHGMIRIKEKILKLSVVKGYPYITLLKNGKRVGFSIHRLIATAFIERIEGKTHVNHINGIKSDNRIENLEWCTHAENMRHAIEKGLKCNIRSDNYNEILKSGRFLPGSKNRSAKLCEKQVSEIKNSDRSITAVIIVKDYNISAGIVRRIRRGEIWKHIG
jgi:hypothetical protein